MKLLYFAAGVPIVMNDLSVFLGPSEFRVGKLYLTFALKCLLGWRSISGGLIGVDETLSNL